MAPDRATLAERIGQVRSFNRFYTAHIGALADGHLGSRYGLTEARILYEVGQSDVAEVADIRRRLGLDASYLSRILGRFESDGLLRKERSQSDARKRSLRLTAKGRAELADLDRRAVGDIRDRIDGLDDRDQARLVSAMATVSNLLGADDQSASTAASATSASTGTSATSPAYVIRTLRPGDLGWVVHRNGVLYAEEYGWDQTYEALVARIVADYRDNLDPAKENAWIAELRGRPVGSVFCVRNAKEPDSTAQLRLLLVEPTVRGMGIGSALVEECLRFARDVGYQRIVLWTNDVLESARRIYQRAGFALLESEPHHSFGQDLVGQYWGLNLRSSRSDRG